jgi:hypothetical protein
MLRKRKDILWQLASIRRNIRHQRWAVVMYQNHSNLSVAEEARLKRMLANYRPHIVALQMVLRDLRMSYYRGRPPGWKKDKPMKRGW